MRFLLGGAINTGFTYLLYLALKIVMGYQLAYFSAFAAGIVFAYWFNAVFVFDVALSWKRFFSYPLVYIIQYAASAFLLGYLVEIFGASEVLAPLVVAAAMIPLTYMMNKFVLRLFLGQNNRRKT